MAICSGSDPLLTERREDGSIDGDDGQLVRRAADGDAGAFGELVARHRSSALRVATVVLGGAHASDDVVQDATVRAWRAIGTLDTERSFRPWYLRIVANCARNDRRSTGRRAALEVRRAFEREPATPSPEEIVVSDAERRRVVAALNRLDADDRLVIALRHFEQLSETEMVEVCGWKRGTVKSRLSRATARLRLQLERIGGDLDA